MLNSQTFRKEVLGKENTYFVMFGMKECAPCDEMASQYERLAKNMKAIGIKVGRVNCDENQDIALQFNIQQVPKLMLFRPNKESLEYQGDRTERSMKAFILEHQLGEKFVTHLNKQDRIDKFFNKSARIPRVLLMSSRKEVPPVFKQLCYHFRRGLVCGFVSELDERLDDVKTCIANYNTTDDSSAMDLSEIEFPKVYVLQPKGTVGVTEYEGKHNYEAMSAFVAPFSTWKEKEDPDEKREREKKERAEKEKKRRQEERARRAEKAKAKKEKDEI